MSKILIFPYEKIRNEVEVHQAKILKMPVREVDIWMLPMALGLIWFTSLLPPLK